MKRLRLKKIYFVCMVITTVAGILELISGDAIKGLLLLSYSILLDISDDLEDLKSKAQMDKT